MVMLKNYNIAIIMLYIYFKCNSVIIIYNFVLILGIRILRESQCIRLKELDTWI